MLVGFGQVICLPVGPRCDLCLLGKEKICPSRVAGVGGKGRKEVVYTFTAEGDGAEEEVKLEVMEDEDEDGVKAEGSERVELEVTDEPLAKVEVGYQEGPPVKLEPGVAEGL